VPAMCTRRAREPSERTKAAELAPRGTAVRVSRPRPAARESPPVTSLNVVDQRLHRVASSWRRRQRDLRHRSDGRASPGSCPSTRDWSMISPTPHLRDPHATAVVVAADRSAGILKIEVLVRGIGRSLRRSQGLPRPSSGAVSGSAVRCIEAGNGPRAGAAQHLGFGWSAASRCTLIDRGPRHDPRELTDFSAKPMDVLDHAADWK